MSFYQHGIFFKPRGIAFAQRWLGEFSTMFFQELVSEIKKELFKDVKIYHSMLERQITQIYKFLFSKKIGTLWPSAKCEFIETDCTGAVGPYRTPDGSCNNLKRPLYGRALIPFRRLLTAQYEDGIGELRKTSRVTGLPLASPRKISSVVHANSNPTTLDTRISHYVMQWGQFTDHDCTITPVFEDEDPVTGEPVPINCCVNDKPVNRIMCAPISIPRDDPFFKRKCMSFVRSIPTINHDCRYDLRNQINQLSAFIDGSQIYGNSIQEQMKLRTGQNGLMRSNEVKLKCPCGPQRCAQEFLPEQSAASCVFKDNVLPNGPFCLLTGDIRVNEQASLGSMQTLWLREHNRIAKTLKRTNQHWTDQQIFDMARKIIGGMLQHIAYNEHLPIVLGPKIIKEFSLGVKKRGYFEGYNEWVDPSLVSAFSTAAFRFGHSLIRDEVRRNPGRHVKLRTTFDNPGILFKDNGPNSVLKGLTDAAQTFDKLITQEVTEHLYEPPNMPKQGLDLASLNIQRGRDHGLPSYNNYRRLCRLPVAQSFSQMRRNPNRFNIPVNVIRNLEQVYKHVDDVELFPGGLSEMPFKNAHGNAVSVVGPTFACIIGNQFRKLKFGDRFYYENPLDGKRGKARQGFTREQLQQIRRTTLSGIICRNTDIFEIPRRAFFIPGRGNEEIECSTIEHETSLNLSIFQHQYGH